MKSIILSVILLALTEAIVKPIVTRLTQAGIRRYLVPAYSKLDLLLTAPQNWQAFIGDAESFISSAIIPDELPPELEAKLTRYIIDNFDLNTFLSKDN